MIRRYQSRTGDHGNCFATVLSCILETKVPEFGINVSEDKYWGNVTNWLAQHGLKYERVPIVSGLEPVGYSTMEGISPRGGLHACVAKDGKIIWDPHPQDGTGRGLIEPKWYGLLISENSIAKDEVGRPHKSLGDKPFKNGQRVRITEYVTGDRNGIVLRKEDTDSQDSWNYFIYLVKPDGLPQRFYTEYEIKTA